MVKICHITSAHTRYDIRIFVKECVTLAKAGHNVSLIVADGLLDEIKDGVNIYSVSRPASRQERMQQTPKEIFNKVLALKPQVVHFHDPELMLIGRKLVKHKVKVIYDVHEDLPKQVMNKYWLPKFVRPLISKLVARLERTHSRRFYGVIAATPIIEKRFKQYNGNTISVCNYPVLEELKSAYVDWSEREDLLCYIGSISKTRGIIPVIQSLALSKSRLALAGVFSGDISKKDIVKLDISKSVDYLGVLNRKEVTQLLTRVKVGLVTLLPTPSYIESLPIKMFEYMLAGIPVIASDFPLWREIIEKYDCGILVNPNEPSVIANACKEFLTNQDKARTMGENGRLAILKHFNWEQEQAKLLDFYSAIC